MMSTRRRPVVHLSTRFCHVKVWIDPATQPPTGVPVVVLVSAWAAAGCD